MKPEELLYAKTHEWVHVSTNSQGQKIATVGISSFAVEALTDLVFIDLPETGEAVQVGESFGEIESVKAVSDLYSPVSGEIVEVNTQLADHLERLNEDPYNAGWMIKVRIADESALKHLMDHKAYQKQCAEEQH